MTDKAIPGLHHVTAISGPPQANVNFFTGVLDQRLVKRTVNFDDPGTYHLYYGDYEGNPGTILTFFPFVGAVRGKPGAGMASAYSYAIPEGRFDDWLDRLKEAGVKHTAPEERFGARVITVTDPDGAVVELIETGRKGGGTMLDGFHSVTLWLGDIGPTAALLTEVMGYEEAGHEKKGGTERLRLRAPGDARGAVVELMRRDGASWGRQGAGSIHHVAFRAESDAVQLEWRERLLQAGMQVTPPIDRQYFNAIYFREPGGVLFEIATDPPGFAADEPVETLGRDLKLPAQYEPYRKRIEEVLPPLKVPA